MENVISNLGEKEDEVSLLGQPVRLSWISDNVWVASASQTLGCDVLNTSDNTLSQLSFDGLSGVYSFWQTSDSEVVAACVDGLYSLSPQGTLRYEICNGHFTDVCSSDDSLVAIEMLKCEVQVFKINSEKWVLQHAFTVNNADQRFKNICVQGGVVHICDCWYVMIYKYTLSGEYLEQHGSTRGQTLGQFSAPYVSGTDCNNTLIVCDTDNHRVQTKSQMESGNNTDYQRESHL